MREIIRPVCVIYHDQCPDGFGAAWAAFHALGYTTANGSLVHYIPSKYDTSPPQSYNLLCGGGPTTAKLIHRPKAIRRAR